MNLKSPLLFISYSRTDKVFVERLVSRFKEMGFRVFLDTSDIDPGDNFVTKLSSELKRSTAVIPIISKNYSKSRWAQAELYYALTSNKMIIPVLIGNGEIASLDDPLERLLRDTQYFAIDKDLSNRQSIDLLIKRLSDARKKYKLGLFKKTIPYIFSALLLIGLVWWAIANINYIKQNQTRKNIFNTILTTNEVLQTERIAQLASSIAGDQNAAGELNLLSQDPTQSSTARFNAIALESELRKGQEEYRWYIKNLSLLRVKLENTNFVETTFIDGIWDNVEFFNSVFANVVWSQNEKFTMSDTKFENTQFIGSQFYNITSILTEFKNSKFVGSTVDTTNFSKVKFITENPETEGNQIITPKYTLFDKSTVISNRTPPNDNVIDLSKTGDDIVFDNVHFVDTRFKGWFNPEWFRNSSFENCEFPDSLSKKTLQSLGNTIQ